MPRTSAQETVTSVYQIKSLQDTHYEIMRRLVMGQKSIDIAKALGVTEVVVCYVKGSQLAQKQMELMRGARDKNAVDVATQIRELGPKCVSVLEEVLENDSHPIAVRVKVALDVLSKGGHDAPTKVQGAFVHGFVTREEVEEIKRRVRANQANIVDAEVEEVGRNEESIVRTDSCTSPA